MDGKLFDGLTRHLTKRLTRRHGLGLLAIPGLPALSPPIRIDARKKNRKKKRKKKKIELCHEGQTTKVAKKKKKKHLGHGDTLGPCPVSTVECGAGTKLCGTQCISTSGCCTSADCEANAECVRTVCVCAAGFHLCGGACQANDLCCTDADCAGDRICQAGACVPPPYCTGRNTCEVDAFCHAEPPGCLCWVEAVTGAPFCGLGADTTRPCSECTSAETCVDLTGPECNFLTGCALPCPSPL